MQRMNYLKNRKLILNNFCLNVSFFNIFLHLNFNIIHSFYYIQHQIYYLKMRYRSSLKIWNGNAENVINACRVEVEFQIEIWGCVEGQHDYDRLNCRIQVLSAALFLQSLKQMTV